ncbi:MAG TPA: hypothetical protein VF878_06420, partial [Candidatus Udaeobacter sp.]
MTSRLRGRSPPAILTRLRINYAFCGEPNAVSNAIGYAMHRSRSHHAVIRVYDGAGNVFETHGRARGQHFHRR